MKTRKMNVDLCRLRVIEAFFSNGVSNDHKYAMLVFHSLPSSFNEFNDLYIIEKAEKRLVK